MSQQLHLIDHMGPGGAQQILRDRLIAGESFYILPLRQHPDSTEHPFILPTPSGLLSALQTLRGLSHDFPDLTTLHAHLSKSFFLARMASPLPVIFHEHGSFLELGPVERRLYRSLLRSQSLVSPSPFLTERLLRAGFSADQVSTITPTIPPVPPHIGSRTGHRLLFVGRLSREKGVSLLPQILAHLPSSYTLDIIGSGSQLTALQKLVRKLDLTSRVRFLGFQDARPLYQHYDCLLIPSLRESLSLVALEASCCGIPVVASEVGGLPFALSAHPCVTWITTRGPALWASAVKKACPKTKNLSLCPG